MNEHDLDCECARCCNEAKAERDRLVKEIDAARSDADSLAEDVVRLSWLLEQAREGLEDWIESSEFVISSSQEPTPHEWMLHNRAKSYIDLVSKLDDSSSGGTG